MPRLLVNDVYLYYEEFGDGFPLVLLHPWPTDHAMWMYQIPILSEDYRVIAPDSRGLGRSEKPKKGYRLRDLTEDLKGLLDQLGVDKAFIVGSSLGANVSQRFTIDHPERVQATVWIGGARLPMDQMLFEGSHEAGREIGERSFTEVYLEALRNGGYTKFWETIWKPTMHFQFHESFSKSDIGSYLIKYLFEERYARLNQDATGVIGLLEAFRQEESLDEDLAHVKVSSSMVVGEDDDSRQYCEEQYRTMPNVSFHLIKNGGHFCYMDQPETFNQYLASFLRANNPE